MFIYHATKTDGGSLGLPVQAAPELELLSSSSLRPLLQAVPWGLAYTVALQREGAKPLKRDPRRHPGPAGLLKHRAAPLPASGQSAGVTRTGWLPMHGIHGMPEVGSACPSTHGMFRLCLGQAQCVHCLLCAKCGPSLACRMHTQCGPLSRQRCACHARWRCCRHSCWPTCSV